MNSPPLSVRPLALYALAALAVWFALLGHRDLIEPDEGRYAEIAREMVVTGDWLTPRLNGFKYFEKPALHYWATALSLKAFGFNNAAARLWPVLIGALGIVWTGFVAYRLYGREAAIAAAAVCLGSALYVSTSHYISLDISVSVFLAMGIGCLALAQTRRDEPRALRIWMLWGWAALALATMSKGLIGIVLPGATVVAYSLWQRDWSLWRHLHLGKGTLVFLAIAAPWFIAVSLANPEFARFFFIHEHFERYTTTVHQRDAPMWFFVPIFIVGVMPWLVSAVRGLVSAARPTANQPGTFSAERFFVTFIAVVFVFFSAGSSKLPPYILPLLPILAVLAGQRMAQVGRARADGWITLALGIALIALATQAARFGSKSIPAELYLNYQPWIIAAGVAFVAAGVISLRSNGRAIVATAGVALCAALATQCLMWGFQTIAESRSSHALAAAIEREAPGAEVFIDTYYPQSLPFYLNRTVRLAKFKGELEMGINAEPQRWLATADDLAREWLAAEKAVGIFDVESLPIYQAKGLKMRVIFQHPRRIAVVKEQ